MEMLSTKLPIFQKQLHAAKQSLKRAQRLRQRCWTRSTFIEQIINPEKLRSNPIIPQKNDITILEILDYDI